MATTESVIHLEVTIDDHTESADLEVTLESLDLWIENRELINEAGTRKSKELFSKGHKFVVKILGATQALDKTDGVYSSALLELDGKLSQRLDAYEFALPLINCLTRIDPEDKVLPKLLSTAIQGWGLYVGDGEMFLELYGRFIQEYKLKDQKQQKEKMIELMCDMNKIVKEYVWENGKKEIVPLPVFVRNVIAHPENKHNRIDRTGTELRQAEELLKSWLGD